jgi:hypothetical protein
MSQYNNIGPIANGVSDSGFTPDKYFNNLSLPPINISQNANDAIETFFEHATGSKASGAVLATAVIFTSGSLGINPMDTLSEFQKLPKGELNDYLTVFLNYNRVGTSLLAFNNAPNVNQFIKRSILV